MRTWKQFLRNLTREPVGYRGEGSVLGLGLATAQEQARRQAADEVEDYLRGKADEQRSTTTS
ncbi:hypothetical protein BAY61_23640 [Prauserella marina]|uniref:Uncharacterized protein n=1 Tax=Prauserella marina TaxID=530584 RepID=A0A222W0Z2_9PSEU|nr:hypothetical protein [Prauserella marina]ASR39593.1 hypothetical protein BAY61_23640 [Prauserella marina]PWV74604.1 hypothetical protein DES30_1072 [Prauserella marina]SDD45509.1 hypothetical protein SAMN05421630_108249 [Prauserella marina]